MTIIADGPTGPRQIDMNDLTDEELLQWSASGSAEATHILVMRAAGRPWQQRASDQIEQRRGR